MTRLKSTIVIGCLLAMTCAPSAVAARAISLPLAGYYHPGRYIPVEYASDGTPLQISTDDPLSIPTRFNAPAGNHAIAPLLIIGEHARSITTGISGFTGNQPAQDSSLPSLRALGPGDRLIGISSDIADPLISRQLFPDHPQMRVTLAATSPLPGIAGAWESLDAVALSEPSALLVPAATLQALWASGTTIAIECTASPTVAPSFGLHFSREGNWWIARPLLPMPPAICPAAYDPTLGWNPGRSAPFRRQIVLMGLIVTILGCAATLLQRDHQSRLRLITSAIIAPVCATAIIVATIYIWHQNQSPIAQANSAVTVAKAESSFFDSWRFLRSASDAPFSIECASPPHPLLYDESQLTGLAPRLEIDSAGRMIFTATLRAAWPLVLLDRSFIDRSEQQPHGTIDAHLRALLTGSFYAQHVILTQSRRFDRANEDWGTAKIGLDARR